MPYVSDVGPGPGFFPLWLGIGLIVFSFGLALPALQRLRGKLREPQSGGLSGRALAAWLALMIAVALLGRLGFTVAFVALTAFLLLVLDRRPAPVALAVGVGLAVAFHLIFVVALDVALPKAVWGF